MLKVLFSKKQMKKVKADVLVWVVREVQGKGAFAELDRVLGGGLQALAEAEGFEGKKGQTLTISPLGAMPVRRVLVVGVGEQEMAQASDWMKVVAACVRSATSLKASSLALGLTGDKEALLMQSEGAVLGTLLAMYEFTQYKSKESTTTALESLQLLLPSKTSAETIAALEENEREMRLLAEGICEARDLVNEPPCVLTPVELANRAKKMAKEVGLKCEILDEKKMEELGMHMFLAVGRGSVQPSRLIHLTYTPKRKSRKKDRPVLAFVGKGVTFDSGGLSLKPANFMLNMHTDMAGSAAVFGAMRVIAQRAPNVEVHGYLAASENMTGAAAYKLNDVVKAYNGKTVEIHNTDAEGRLVLGDTLSYACENGATEVIDLATLTGACLVALGRSTAGLMGNDEAFVKGLCDVAGERGESVWHLPLLDDLRASLKSSVADLKNVGDRYGGAISAGLFLQEFVSDDVKWAHIDIAGPSLSEKESEHLTKGGTGFGVATLVQYALNRA